MELAKIYQTYQNDLNGMIGALLDMGIKQAQSFCFQDSEDYFEKAYSLSLNEILDKYSNQSKDSLSEDFKNQFAEIFSKYVAILYLSRKSNMRKFSEFIPEFKKNNEEICKDLFPRIQIAILNDVDSFYLKFFQQLNYHFYNNLNIFQLILQKADDKSIVVGLTSTNRYLRILKRHKEYIKSSLVDDICVALFTNFQNYYMKDIKSNEKNLRTIDETKFNYFVNFLRTIFKGSNLRQLDKLENDVLVEFLMSDYLAKQFFALSKLNSFTTLSKDQIEQIQQRDVITKLVFKSKLHQDLILQFATLLSRLFEYNFYDDKIIDYLWTRSFEQVDSFKEYFNAWPILQAAIPNKANKFFWNLVLTKTPTLDSEYIRAFFIKVSSRCPEQLRMPITDFIWTKAIESENSKEFVEVITSYLPNDIECKKEIKNRCFALLQNDTKDKVMFSLEMLDEIWKNLNETQTKIDFDFLLRNCTTTSENAVILFDLLQKISSHLANPFTIEELEMIEQLISSIITTDSQTVFNFVQKLFDNPDFYLFTPELLLSFFEWMTRLPEVDSVIFQLIKNIFGYIYSSNESHKYDACIDQAIECLWDFLYRSTIPDAAEFLVFVHLKKNINKHTINEKQIVNDFIEKCFKKLDCFGSLTALTNFIINIEDNLILSDYGIQRNLFIGNRNKITIQLVGDYQGQIEIPEETTYLAFKAMVRDVTRAKNSQIILKSGQFPLRTSHKFRHLEKIKVYFDENSDVENDYSDSSFSDFDISVYPIKWKKETLPSQIIFQNIDQLKDLLDNENKQICDAALTLLNYLSIDPKEVNLLKTEDDLFDINHPYLLIYRLNLLANLNYQNDMDVLSHLFNSNLYSQLVNNVCNLKKETFAKPEYFDVLIDTVVDINETGSKIKELKKAKQNSLKDIVTRSDEAISSIIDWILDLETKTPVYYNLVIDFLIILCDLIQIDAKVLIEHPKFQDFFDMTIFNPEPNIRSSFYNLLTHIKTRSLQEFTLSRLPLSRKGQCNEFFRFISRIIKNSKTLENTQYLFNALIDSLNENLFIYKSVHVNSKKPEIIEATRDLCADLASSDYIKGIIDNLEKLFPLVYDQSNFDVSIEKPSLLLSLLVDQIVFNTNRYVASPPSLFSLLKMILDRFPSLFPPLIRTLTKINESHISSSKKNPNLQPTNLSIEKGIDNLGCTCYLNSSLQQIYHIKETRNAIFSYDPSQDATIKPNEEMQIVNISKNWLCQLQLLMANLRYSPLSSVDASGFVSNWKMYGNTPVNPGEQQDAVEFLQLLLDRIDTHLPSKPVSKSIRGQIIHTTKQINGDFESTSFEDFIFFPLEVMNQKTFDESFDAFLVPDIFDGDNQYKAEGIGLINASRSHAIKKSPEILIFQLKRFDFDLSTLKRKKINSEFEIEDEVDIKKILTQTEIESNSLYELFGIIEHLGNAEGGHYYSFIKNEDNKWKSYNDSIVSDIKEKSVFKTAKGQTITKEFFDPVTRKMKTTSYSQNESAYILFYRKKKTENTQTNLTDTEADEEEENKENAEILAEYSDEPIQLMPERMLIEFFKNLKELIIKHIIYSKNYIDFIDFISKVDNQDTFSFIFQYTMKSIRSNSNAINGSAIIHTAMEKVKTEINFAKFVLKKDDNRILSTLYHYYEEKQASQCCDLAIAAISFICETDPTDSNVKEFINTMINLKSELVNHCDKIDYVFRIFHYYLQKSKTPLEENKKYLDFLLDIMNQIENKPKFSNPSPQKVNIKANRSTVAFTEGIRDKQHIGPSLSNDNFKLSSIHTKSINLNYVFKSITYLITHNDFSHSDDNYFENIQSRMINQSCFNFWTKNQKHLFEFCCMLINFLKDNKELTDKFFEIFSSQFKYQNSEVEETSDDSSGLDKPKKKSKRKSGHKSRKSSGITFAESESSECRDLQWMSAIFANILLFKDTLTSYRVEWFITFITKQNMKNVDIDNFLRLSSTCLKQFISKHTDFDFDPSPLFASTSRAWLKLFLMTNDTVIRNACIVFIYSVFPSFPKLFNNGINTQDLRKISEEFTMNDQKRGELNSLLLLFNSLISMQKELILLTKEYVNDQGVLMKASPSTSFFEILAWASNFLIEFLNNDFSLTKYSVVFSDIITKLSQLKYVHKNGLVDLLHFIHITFVQTNLHCKNREQNVLINLSNINTYLNAISKLPSDSYLLNYLNNVTSYFVPVILPFLDKIESQLIKSKFFDSLTKETMSTWSLNQQITDTMINNLGNDEDQTELVSIPKKTTSQVILELMKKIKFNEKIGTMLWKRKKDFSWGSSAIFLSVSYVLLSTQQSSAAKFFIENNCHVLIMNSLIESHDNTRVDLKLWTVMLKVIHLLNTICFVNQSPSAEKPQEKPLRIMASKSTPNFTSIQSSNVSMKKQMMKIIDQRKSNFQFLTTIHSHLKSAVESYSSIAIDVLRDFLIYGSPEMIELIEFGVDMFQKQKTQFYSYLMGQEIRRKYGHLEVDFLQLSINLEQNEKKKKSKKISDSSSKPHLISNEDIPKSIIEREIQRLLDTQIYDSTLFDIFLSQIKEESIKTPYLIDFLSHFADLNQIDERFIQQSILFLKEFGISQEESDTIVKHVMKLLEEEISQISLMINIQQAKSITYKLVMADFLLKQLIAQLNVAVKFPGKSNAIVTKAFADVRTKRDNNESYEDLYQIFKQIAEYMKI